MDIYTFVGTSLLAFLGLFVGLVLSHYSEEEVQSFKKYIPFIQLSIFVLMFLLLFWYLPFFIASSILVLSFAFIYLYWHRKNLNVLDYIIISVLFALTSLSKNFQMYMTLLTFLFGIFSGSLFYVLHRRHTKEPKHILHHKHSGRHLSFGQLSIELFNHYYFFLIISFVAYLLANLFKYLIFKPVI